MPDKKITDQIVEQLNKISEVVAELKADKDRRDTDKAERIESLHNEIITMFKQRGTPLDEMLTALKVTELHVTSAYIDSRRSYAQPSDQAPTKIENVEVKQSLPPIEPIVIKR